MIVLDTGGLYAALDANEALHGRAVASLVGSAPPRVISPFVLAELDYLIGTRVGHQAQMALVDEVTRGVYQLEPFLSEDVGHAKRVMEGYADLRIGCGRRGDWRSRHRFTPGGRLDVRHVFISGF